MNRRELLGSLAATAAVGAISPELQAQTPAAGGWAIKPLPFDPKKLKGLSEKLLVSHHDNNYAGAARRIGQIQQMLASRSEKYLRGRFVQTRRVAQQE